MSSFARLVNCGGSPHSLGQTMLAPGCGVQVDGDASGCPHSVGQILINVCDSSDFVGDGQFFCATTSTVLNGTGQLQSISVIAFRYTVLTGACCFEDGTCVLLSGDECVAVGGTWTSGVDCDGSGCPSSCPVDTNGDGVVDAADLAAVLECWGLLEDDCLSANVNVAGESFMRVGPEDLAVVLENWGPCD